MSGRPRAHAHTYAIVEDGVVTNVVVAEASFAAGRPDFVRVDTVRPRPGPGWSRRGNAWHPPQPPRAPAAQVQDLLPPP